MSSPDNIFKRAYATPSMITDEYNDFSYSIIQTCFSHFFFLLGWETEALQHRTFCFAKSESIFKSLSVKCQITRKSKSAIVEMTCPFPEHFTPEHFTHQELDLYVRLYTKDPDNNTVSAYAFDIWNYKPEIHLFQYLCRDFSWFKENLEFIKIQLAENNDKQLESLNKMVLYMQDAPSNLEFGKRVAKELTKDVFSLH